MKALLYLSLTVLLLGCKKETEEDKLPPATQTGANTGGYLLDEQAIVANGVPGTNGILSSTQPTPNITGGFVNDTTILINLNELKNDQIYSLYLFARYHGVGVYHFNHKNTTYYSGSDNPRLRNYAMLFINCRSCLGNQQVYVTDSLRTGTLTISAANVRALAGQFEFGARDNQQKVVQVTKGRFDLHL